MNFNQHTIPFVFYRFPILIQVIHLWNRCILLRNWHVLQQIKKIARKHDLHSFFDVGCGDGQHYFWLHKNYPEKAIFAVDKIEDNVKFCNHYLGNSNCYQGNAEDFTLALKMDCILLIGLLQYIEKDELALLNLKNMLSEQGKIIFYCPINGRNILRVYHFLYHKYNNYEKTQQRQRVYQETELIALFKKVGLRISTKKYTMGTLGILSQEIYASLLILFENFKLKPLILLVIYLFSPLLLVLNCVDYFARKKTGNGVLLILEKTTN